ncbi:DUF4349 domain-containing protein, partial [Nonomuraea zeae]
MTRIRYGIALSALCMVVSLAGCGGSGSSSTGGGGVESAMSTSGREAPAMAGRQSDAAVQDQSLGEQQRPQDKDGIVSNVKVTQQERQVIYTGSMTVRAKQVGTAVQQAKQIVIAAGGYLSKEESSSASDSEDTAMLEFKIPPARYAEVLGRLGKDLGKQISMNQGTQDVTLQMADVESRLKSAQQSLESLRTLLKRADTIGQVLQVEREISTREADLESLQAQQKELATQVAMATLTLRLVGPVAVVEEPEDEPAGFLGGLKSGWAALVAFLKGAATATGVLLPWMIVVLPVVALLVWLARRRNRAALARTRPAAGPPASAPHGPGP